MDDDVAAAELLARLGAQPEPVLAEVQLQDGELVGGKLAERLLPQLLLEPPEGRAGQHLPVQAVCRRTPGAGADGEVDTTDLGKGAEQLLDDGLAEEARGAGDQQGSTGGGFFDQGDDCTGRTGPISPGN